MKKSRRNQKGMALVASYMVFGVLAVVGAGFMTMSLTEARAGNRHQRFTQTLYLAEAGMDQALVSLRQPAFAAAVADVAGADAEIVYTDVSQYIAGADQGGFEVDVDPVAGQPNVYRIQSTGYYPGRQANLEGYQFRTLEAYAQLTQGGMIPPGLFADMGMDLTGSLEVDSYDSRIPGLPVSTGRGMVGSNGTVERTIDITGSVRVNGDVLSGPGSNEDAIRMVGGSEVTGQVGPAQDLVAMPPVQANVGSVVKKVTGEEILPGGIHYFKELEITSRGQLSIAAPVTIYVEKFSMTGQGFVNQTGLPANLMIKVVGSEDVKLTGATGFTGVIYAPESEIKLAGSNEFYGAVAGKEIVGHGNAQIWYDEALKNTPLGSNNQTQVVSWQELD